MATESTFTVLRNGTDFYAIARVWSSEIDGSLSFDVRTVHGDDLADDERETVRDLAEYVHGCLASVGCSAGPFNVTLRARYGFEYAGFAHGSRSADLETLHAN